MHKLAGDGVLTVVLKLFIVPIPLTNSIRGNKAFNEIKKDDSIS